MSSQTAGDGELDAVVGEIRKLDPKGLRIARVLRDTLDRLYDGARTGRYRWDQLYKTEKTHCGTLVEINLQREFKFQDGEKLDYRIAQVEVDCKYSQRIGGWMIPPEAQGHLCLLAWAEDTATPKWSLGLLRATFDRLNTGINRDAKATLNERGRQAMTWLFRNMQLRPNVLLQLEQATVDRIMAPRHGTKRVDELFRCTQGTIVSRAAVATVAQQQDNMKRARASGGSRTALKPEGIVILGQYKSHAKIARALGLPVPGQGDLISIRVAPANEPGSGVAVISGGLWRVAVATDPVMPAPDLPSV